MIGPWSILTLISIARASPSVFLPINSQVPPVARANQPFEFVFADSTFTSSSGTIIYTIFNGPGWLRMGSGSRTFSGTPASSDAGSFVVDLVASDSSPGSTTMPVTFVVSTNAGPELGISVADQLSTLNGFSSPDSLLLPHSTALSLSFSSDTFTNTNANTIYYALCANNTPLPSWINFDPNDLSFSGTAPLATSLAELPQTYTIEMTASDVAGFAGAIATFSIVVVSHMFAFGSSYQIVNVTSGSALKYSGLQSSLSLNGQLVNSSVIATATAATPSWLALDPKTLALSGTPPAGVISQNITVNATDIYGDIASTTIWLQTASNSTAELLGSVPTLTAKNGSDFVYDLNRTLTNTSATIDVHLGQAAIWLNFDPHSMELKGHVPSDLTSQSYVIDVTASLGSQSQSQLLTIDVQSSSASASPTSNSQSSTGSSSNHSGSTTAEASSGGPLRDKRWIALPVVLPIFVLLVAFALFFCCCRRRKQKKTYECESMASSSHSFHGPVHEKNPRGEEAAVMSGALDSQQRSSSRISRPPIIDIPGVWKSYTTRRNSQLRTSQASAEGGGRASRADSWHRYTMNFNVRPKSAMLDSTAVITEKNTPKTKDPPSRYKYKAPEFPRFSVSTRSSPTHRYSRNHQTRSNMSFTSSAFFGSQMTGFGHGRSIPSQGSSGLLFGTKGIGHGDGGGPPGYGTVRDSWRNFRLANLLGSVEGHSGDGETYGYCLAHPPPCPTASKKLDKSSIRLVPSSSRGHHHRRSTIQTLSTVKTNSTYRRNPPTDPLQEFHRRRLLLKNSERALFTAGPSSAHISSYTTSLPRTLSVSKNGTSKVPHRGSSVSILPSTPENRSPDHQDDDDHSISETSSLSALSPLARSSPSKSSIHHQRPTHLRHNTYSTSGPGVRLPLIGRSNSSRANTLMSDDQDSRWESASSDAQSLDPYIYSREVNNGHRETALFDNQSEVGSGVGNGTPRYGMERFARGLKGLSWSKAGGEGSAGSDEAEEDDERGRGRGRQRVKVGSTLGKTFGTGKGIAKGEPGNMSFRGDIRRMDDEGGSAFV